MKMLTRKVCLLIITLKRTQKRCFEFRKKINKLAYYRKHLSSTYIKFINIILSNRYLTFIDWIYIKI